MSLSQISSIVEEQLIRWSYRSQKRALNATKKYPTITVSRQYGTCGSQIAEKVAKQLGYDFWDQNLVHKVSESSGLTEELTNSLDERVKSFIEDAISAMALGSSASEKNYIKQVVKTIQVISEHGKAVIVGRGSQFILKEDTLKIRLIAPLSYRIRAVAHNESTSTKEAELKIQMIDKERMDFHQKHFAKDIRQASYYDLCINVENFNQDAVTSLIVHTLSKYAC
jgi:cytidylate kinase